MSSRTGFDEYGLDKKRTILLLRSVLVISLSYLVLFTEAGTAPHSVGYILALIVSNLALVYVPPQSFNHKHFAKVLFFFDTAAVLIGLYFTVGFSQDFLIAYFFTMFLTAMVETIHQIAIGAVLVSITYGSWLWMTSGETIGSAEWLRLPFFFIVAVFYAYMTEEVKRERTRRLQAEREGEHLRFLLLLGDAFARKQATQDWAAHVRSVIESAFPRLACSVQPVAPHGGDQNHQVWVPFASGERTFGGLLVEARDGMELSPDEMQFCRVAALVAANGLHTAEQARAAGDLTRLKEEFLSTLSHEFRTPLHGLLGYADLLEDAVCAQDGSLVRENLNRLRANAQRLQSLLEELLWFAEIRAGHRPQVIEPVDLREIFDQLANAVSPQLQGRPVRLEVKIGADVPVLHTDGRKLRQIVSGLLSNALKFTDQGLIRLSARCLPGSEVEISVEDSGIGIDARHHDLIFEEFRQVDGSLTRQTDGLGLGLALARELAGLLGGRISVESRVEQGSTFRVRLPRREADLHDSGASVAQLRLASNLVH
jgi:signal transduction histidine kinase